MTHLARGTFTVQMTPQGEPGTHEGVSLGRMLLDKRFEGDLAGTGQGQMLTALTRCLAKLQFLRKQLWKMERSKP